MLQQHEVRQDAVSIVLGSLFFGVRDRYEDPSSANNIYVTVRSILVGGARIERVPLSKLFGGRLSAVVCCHETLLSNCDSLRPIQA